MLPISILSARIPDLLVIHSKNHAKLCACLAWDTSLQSLPADLPGRREGNGSSKTLHRFQAAQFTRLAVLTGDK